MAIEYWMRGPVENIPALLQPVAHTLLQAQLEINEMMTAFPESLLWEKPAGAASPGFHLQHIRGVQNRLFTYATAQLLQPDQLEALAAEGKPGPTLSALLERLNQQVSSSLAQLAATDPATLTDFRGVGRKQLPSTVMGLLFHAAEHTMRHTGQLLVTVKVLKGQ